MYAVNLGYLIIADTYINGECKEDDDSVEGDEIACLDTNAKCSGNKCICRTGFSQTNGICTIGKTY